MISYTPTAAASTGKATTSGPIPFTPSRSYTPPAQPNQPPQTKTLSDGTTIQPGSGIVANLKALPGQIFNAAKTVLTGNTGEELAAGIGAGQAAKTNLDQTNEQFQNLQTAIQARNKLKAAGVDTSHADQMIQDQINSLGEGSSVAEVLPHSQDSNTEVAGNMATIAGSILGAGTYGKAAKGAVTGTLSKATELTVPKTLAGAASDTAKGIVDTVKPTPKPYDSALARILPDYSASTPTQKTKLIGETVAGAPRVTEGGILASRAVNPTPLEKEAATELSQMPGYR